METSSLALTFSVIGVLLLVLSDSEGVKPPSNIYVNKCCNIGELLNENHRCAIGASEQWWPIIYMIKKQSMFEPHGSAPRFFKVKERAHPYCAKPEFVYEPHSVALFSNGSLFLRAKSKFIEADNFCVDKDVAIVCDPDAHRMDAQLQPRRATKIRKCCGRDAVYRTKENMCAHMSNANAPEQLLTNATHVEFVFDFPDCKISKYFTIAEEFDESNLDVETGRLVLQTGRKLESKSYCLEFVQDGNGMTSSMPSVSVFTCADHLSAPLSDAMDIPDSDIRFILFPIGLLISAVFLSATLAARYILPTNHHILHWRCQTFYVTCLLIGDLLLAFTQLFGRNVNGVACISVAVLMHFFFLSAFFWLNTMCFNIWWTFSNFRPTSLERSQEKRRLRIYMLYAWGVPLIISGIAAALDHMRKSSVTQSDSYLRPRFCEKEYWFAGNLEKLAFFYGPIGLLLCINMLMFASTTRHLTCGLWKQENVKSTTERTTLGRICIKLVIVMGITWIADILSWAHGIWFGSTHFIWIITDLINALQGVFIFIVIGCQPQVSNAVKQMWRSKNMQYRGRNPEHSQPNSNSSQLASATNNTFTTSNAKFSAETAC